MLKIEPSSIPALLVRGKAYEQIGDIQTARSHFSQALRSDPDHAEAKERFMSAKSLQRHIQKVA